MWLFLKNESIILWIVVILISLLTAVRVILDTRSPSKTAAYLLLIILFPVVGAMLYFLVGVNYRKRKIYNKKLTRNEQLFRQVQNRIKQDAILLKRKYKELTSNNEELIDLLLGESLSHLTQNKVTVLINGEQKFPSVFDAIEAATQFIHLEYYIFEEDDIGTRLKDLLIKKAHEGVAVRIIFDDFGSHDLWDDFVDEFRDNGVEIYPFFRVHFIFLANRLNYRDHRKVLIIDGKVGFIGGINIADRYINGKVDGTHWRDTHIKIEGNAVLTLQYHFLSNWNFCSGQELGLNHQLFPENIADENDTDLVQIITSGPDYPRPSIMLSYFTAITMARKLVYISTPYFIPNESIVNAIKKAAFSGKDVRLLIPKASDSYFVDSASRFYFQDMLESGVRVYLYDKGVIHAKTLVVDDNLSMVGTANMDLRSFELNFEINAAIYSERVNHEVKQQFFKDLESSTLITLEEWNKRSLLKTFLAALARIMAPLL
ncbi:MAG TPA: cardiolipin synthase [Cyclobacteriaceae bacterium]|nr:cardiolipin synthase [Cyclobacteriaceae bacterium]